MTWLRRVAEKLEQQRESNRMRCGDHLVTEDRIA
jgi:hypothetical protein